MDTPDIRIDDTISNMEDISNTEVFMGTQNSLGAGAAQTNARSITPLRYVWFHIKYQPKICYLWVLLQFY